MYLRVYFFYIHAHTQMHIKILEADNTALTKEIQSLQARLRTHESKAELHATAQARASQLQQSVADRDAFIQQVDAEVRAVWRVFVYGLGASDDDAVDVADGHASNNEQARTEARHNKSGQVEGATHAGNVGEGARDSEGTFRRVTERVMAGLQRIKLGVEELGNMLCDVDVWMQVFSAVCLHNGLSFWVWMNVFLPLHAAVSANHSLASCAESRTRAHMHTTTRRMLLIFKAGIKAHLRSTMACRYKTAHVQGTQLP
jgi:hypothetical protein